MAGIAKHIIGSLGDIGSEIMKEAVIVPKDMVGTALESLGTPKGQKGNTTPKVPTEKPSGEIQAFGAFDAGDAQTKKTVARAALQALAAPPQKKEPTMYEKQQKELEEKKKMEQKQAIEAQQKNLPKMSAKRKRGDLYGMKAKKAGSEIGKNVKAE